MPSDNMDPAGPELQPNLPPNGKRTNGAAPPDGGPPLFEPASMEPAEAAASAKLFEDMETLRKENALAAVDLVKQASVVPVRRPVNDEFVMLSHQEDHNFLAFLYADPILGECYVPKATRDLGWLGDRWRMVQLYVFVTVAGEEGLWPVPLPRPGIRDNPYNMTQREHAMAMAVRDPPVWASIKSNTIAKTYEITWASGDLGRPKFTGRSMQELLKAAFMRDGIIDRFDHPALKRIRGQPT